MLNKCLLFLFMLGLCFFSVLVVAQVISNRIAYNNAWENQKEQILECESDNRHYDTGGKIKKGDGGRAYGIAQFHKKTFEVLKKLARRPELDLKNKDDQLWLFDWALKNGHAHNWTCARWLAAETAPLFKIKKAHILVKGSKKCPTYKLVKKEIVPDSSGNAESFNDAPDPPINASESLYAELPVNVINL